VVLAELLEPDELDEPDDEPEPESEEEDVDDEVLDGFDDADELLDEEPRLSLR
jgi:hypothetical protein